MTTKNIAAKAAAVKSNVPAAKVAANAKNKVATKAERLRTNLIKANASAAKRLETGRDFAAMAAALVEDTKRSDGSARTLAFWMNNTFAEAMKGNRCHWSHFTTANCRTDNEKAILASVEEKRKAVQELALAKGLSNVNKPWSDMKRISLDLFSGGAPREKNAKPLDARQLETLTKLYKACMKEERATELELAVNRTIGQLLVATFKVDLSKLG